VDARHTPSDSNHFEVCGKGETPVGGDHRLGVPVKAFCDREGGKTRKRVSPTSMFTPHTTWKIYPKNW